VCATMDRVIRHLRIRIWLSMIAIAVASAYFSYRSWNEYQKTGLRPVLSASDINLQDVFSDHPKLSARATNTGLEVLKDLTIRIFSADPKTGTVSGLHGTIQYVDDLAVGDGGGATIPLRELPILKVLVLCGSYADPDGEPYASQLFFTVPVRGPGETGDGGNKNVLDANPDDADLLRKKQICAKQ
jgi:hypothetical protein